MKKTRLNALRAMLDKFQRTETTEEVVADWNDDGTPFFFKRWSSFLKGGIV